MAANLVITQHKSAAGADHSQRETLRTLGLRGIGTKTERADGDALRGMLRRVAHLIRVEEKTGG